MVISATFDCVMNCDYTRLSYYLWLWQYLWFTGVTCHFLLHVTSGCYLTCSRCCCNLWLLIMLLLSDCCYLCHSCYLWLTVVTCDMLLLPETSLYYLQLIVGLRPLTLLLLTVLLLVISVITCNQYSFTCDSYCCSLRVCDCYYCHLPPPIVTQEHYWMSVLGLYKEWFIPTWNTVCSTNIKSTNKGHKFFLSERAYLMEKS